MEKLKRVKISTKTWEAFEKLCDKDSKVPNEEFEILVNKALVKEINSKKPPLYVWKS
jgi:hypothetical protein